MSTDAEKIERLRASDAALLLQLGKFVAVGISNTAVSLLTYAALLRVDVVYPVAGAIAFLAGAANGYVLNRRWTFAAADTWQARRRYVLVQLAGLGATTALLWMFVSPAGFGQITAYAMTIPVVTLATFTANRGWTFRSRGQASIESSTS
jgi:putative flippase GtrA